MSKPQFQLSGNELDDIAKGPGQNLLSIEGNTASGRFLTVLIKVKSKTICDGIIDNSGILSSVGDGDINLITTR